MLLTSGLHRIGNDIVAMYFVSTPEGVTLVDAGLAGQWSDLVAELATIGRTVSDIRGVILTHGDSDHIGFAERLRRDHGVPVFVHRADAARARGEMKTSPSWGSIRLRPLLGFLGYSIRKGGLRTNHLSEVVEIGSDVTLELPGSPVIVGMPGHSPGSIAVFFPGVKAVAVGDALTTRHVLTGSTGPQPAPFTDAPDEARASLSALTGLDAEWVLPGHGAPWSGGVREAVRLASV